MNSYLTPSPPPFCVVPVPFPLPFFVVKKKMVSPVYPCSADGGFLLLLLHRDQERRRGYAAPDTRGRHREQCLSLNTGGRKGGKGGRGEGTTKDGTGSELSGWNNK